MLELSPSPSDRSTRACKRHLATGRIHDSEIRRQRFFAKDDGGLPAGRRKTDLVYSNPNLRLGNLRGENQEHRSENPDHSE